jgi:hypothetical protein
MGVARVVFLAGASLISVAAVGWLDREQPPQEARHRVVTAAGDAAVSGIPPVPQPGSAAVVEPVTGVDTVAGELPWLQAPSPPVHGSALPRVVQQPSAEWPLLARVNARSVPISHSYGSPRYHIGKLRLGGLVRVRKPEAPGSACAGGWLELEPRGLLCQDGDLSVAEQPPPRVAVLPAPHSKAILPLRYVKVTSREALRFRHPPSAEALERIRAGDADAIAEHRARPLRGAYFLAVEKQVRKRGRRWLVTHEGNYVRADVTEPTSASALVGATLPDPELLPLAFVVEPEAPVRSVRDGDVVGRASRYARVPLAGSGEPDAFGMVRTTDGYLLSAEHVRVVRAAPRPGQIPDDARWLQIDHAEQTLLAFEGETPVFATLVSSGKPGRDTPTGVHRVQHKILTTTMRGEDRTGPYEVQEVPWVLYYDGPYAIHGAYWHDDFGQTRSHGCTNLAPADGRWVFRFVRPELPAGWHSSSEPGSYVHMTRGS